ncbi:hypothetical protein [Sporomusa sp. KB1]|jgi:hypothetical protein|uniref:hypothetical protein n=1 Tax=Sporomusa sp. KB1 TaxID=943346 RepID=UPI0011A768B2|nr:hypothetical protein [Sporomusa sp. KB1]TWH46008.1 hypothetical protein Salpa_1946 [Sporomusa sp. KB1]
MTLRDEDRINLGCILGDVRATVVTQCGIVYQGTIEDWDCGRQTNTRPDSSTSDSDESVEASSAQRMEECCDPRFIRMTIECIPGNICCPTFSTDILVSPSRVTPILGFTGAAETLYAVGSSILINWDDISSIGLTSTTACLTDDTP